MSKYWKDVPQVKLLHCDLLSNLEEQINTWLATNVMKQVLNIDVVPVPGNSSFRTFYIAKIMYLVSAEINDAEPSQ